MEVSQEQHKFSYEYPLIGERGRQIRTNRLHPSFYGIQIVLKAQLASAGMFLEDLGNRNSSSHRYVAYSVGSFYRCRLEQQT